MIWSLLWKQYNCAIEILVIELVVHIRHCPYWLREEAPSLAPPLHIEADRQKLDTNGLLIISQSSVAKLQIESTLNV